MYYVVGSGPAAISCVQGLVAAGKKVTIIDSGISLEETRQNELLSLKETPYSEWSRDSTSFLRQGMSSGTSGIPLKLAYGSDYPYRYATGAIDIDCRQVETKPSYARGGLSTVWGSATMPYRQEDIEDWPLRIGDLEAGYRAVLGWMPLSACTDDLAKFFPLYTDKSIPLPRSRQASGLLADLKRNQKTLSAAGIHFGGSRIAVRANNTSTGPGCVTCGLCMYGCPYSLIYSSDQTLATLIKSGMVDYIPGVTVQSFEEKDNEVIVHAVSSDGGKKELRAERLFLAAGILNTTTILLRSLEMYDTDVTIQDSQYFLMPLLRLKGTAGVIHERLHTLSQLFLEVFDNDISPYSIHLQTYTYNDLFLDPILAILGPLKRFFPLEAFLGRLLLFQGYLHSKHSASISTSLERTKDGDRLILQVKPNSDTSRMVKKLSMKFAKLVPKTGLIPLIPMIQMGMPGRGFHSGGSFPMRLDPIHGQSDLHGRPQGLKLVHAVDSTILPSIPATTITYTVMANAYRIGASISSVV
jgi:choline dehydrogenase-like flavoprotein